MNRLNKTESAVFLYCRFSVFLKDSFFQIISRLQQLSLCRVELVKLLPIHPYSVDIFSCSGPSGILGSDVKAEYRLIRC